MSPNRSMLFVLALLTTASAVSQVAPVSEGATLFPPTTLSSGFTVSSPDGAPADSVASVQRLRDFRESDIKFRLNDMTALLRDHQHEGWVLAAYPDPNTRGALIGAGFSLDVPSRFHTQTDPLNPQPFVEPSSAELWQAAGLPADKLQQILAEYDHHLNTWTPKMYRRKIIRQTLTPQLTEEEAERLLRISAIEAVVNARAYCRNFDQLTGPQQMALSQLVFQMGFNLQQFVSFLRVLNDPYGTRELGQLDGYLETQTQHWQTVQGTLMDSQWARRYSVRAASVIAMFDPAYAQAPAVAEQRVLAVLHPAVVVRRANRSTATLRLASYNKRPAKGHGKRKQIKRKLT